jgi:hypothetical protein
MAKLLVEILPGSCSASAGSTPRVILAKCAPLVEGGHFLVSIYLRAKPVSKYASVALGQLIFFVKMSVQDIATVSQGRMFAEVVQADTLLPP